MSSVWLQYEINMNFHWLWLVWDTDLFLTVNFYLEHGWYRWHSKESRRWGVGFTRDSFAPKLLRQKQNLPHETVSKESRSWGVGFTRDSFAPKLLRQKQTQPHETISKESRSWGVFSDETPLLLNSLDRNKTCRTKLFLRSRGVEEFFQERPTDSPKTSIMY